MRLRLLIVLTVLVVIAAIVTGAQPKKPIEQPVVVELFTSQGCSSCPPADDLLRKISTDPAMRGKVIPLAFHVDYWNRLGWTDPFSSRLWTARQAGYVRALGLNGAYTPQALVDGREQFVGSNGASLHAAIERAARRERNATVAVRLDGDVVIVDATTAASSDVLLVAFENGLATNVERGENGGRVMKNDGVVRELRRLGSGSVKQRVTMKLRPSMGVAALVQDRDSMHIEAAAVAYR
jgi:hypothetical protein